MEFIPNLIAGTKFKRWGIFLKIKTRQHLEKTAFLMPGQGSYTDTLLMELVQDYPSLKGHIEIANSIVRKYLGKDLGLILHADPSGQYEPIENDFELSQCVVYLLDYFCYLLIEQQGIKPDFLVGHSLGEIPALAASGAFNFEQGLQIICHRTAAVRDFSKQGRMLAVFCDLDRIKSLLKFLSNPSLSIAVLNSSRQILVSGDDQSIAQVENLALAADISTAVIKSQYPFHSDSLFKASCVFYEKIKNIKVSPFLVPVYSPIKRQFYNDTNTVLESLALQLIKRVHFSEALNALYQKDVRCFIEVGGGNALTKITQSHFVGSPLVNAFATNSNTQSIKVGIDSLKLLLAKGSEQGEARIPSLKVEMSEIKSEQKSRIQKTQPNEFSNQFVKEKILDIFKELTNYPIEVLEMDADLESELGLDSVKQTEIIAKVWKAFSLTVPKDLKVSQLTTIRKLAVELSSRLEIAIEIEPAQESHAVEKESPNVVTKFNSISFDEIQVKTLGVYKELTNYPDEVLELDADLESELGLDSVKQTEIISRLLKLFSLPPSAEQKVSQITTIRKAIEMIQTRLTQSGDKISNSSVVA